MERRQGTISRLNTPWNWSQRGRPRLEQPPTAPFAITQQVKAYPKSGRVPNPWDTGPVTRAASQLVKNTSFIWVTLTDHSSPVGINHPAELREVETCLPLLLPAPNLLYNTSNCTRGHISTEHEIHCKNLNFNYKHQLLEEKASHKSPLPASLPSLPAISTIAPIYNEQLNLNAYTSIP